MATACIPQLRFEDETFRKLVTVAFDEEYPDRQPARATGVSSGAFWAEGHGHLRPRGEKVGHDAPSWERESGNSRIRFPVAAKIAFVKAATNGGTPGSPTPAGGAVLSTMCTLVW